MLMTNVVFWKAFHCLLSRHVYIADLVEGFNQINIVLLFNKEFHASSNVEYKYSKTDFTRLQLTWILMFSEEKMYVYLFVMIQIRAQMDKVCLKCMCPQKKKGVTRN